MGWLNFFVVACLIYSYHISKKDKLIGISIFYIFTQCVYIASYKQNRYQDEFEIIKVIFTSNAYSYLLIAILVTQLYFNTSWRDWVIKGFAWLAPLNASYLMYQEIFGWADNALKQPSGVIHYPSINGSLIACSIPLVFSLRYRWFFVVLCLLGIVSSESSMPYLVLAVTLASWAIVKTRKWWSIGVVVPPLLIGLWFERHSLFSSAGRFEAYKFFMRDWWHSHSIWWGSGPGTYIVQAPQHQIAEGFSVGTWWYWLHSEPLQILYEWGLAGAILTLLVYLRGLYWHYKAKEYAFVGVLSGIGMASLFNFPLRYSLFVLFAVAMMPCDKSGA